MLKPSQSGTLHYISHDLDTQKGLYKIIIAALSTPPGYHTSIVDVWSAIVDVWSVLVIYIYKEDWSLSVCSCSVSMHSHSFQDTELKLHR